MTINSFGGNLFLGASETFTATVTLSNGTTQVATGTWSTDAGSVAQVEAATGRVTGAGSGEATIIVDAQGARGTKRIRVLPNYQGNWLGSYVVTGCTPSNSAFASTCTSVFPNGRVLPLALQFTQASGNINGTTAVGSLVSGAVTATIQTDGSVTLLATASLGTSSNSQSWDLRSASDGRITGTVRLVIADIGIGPGSATVNATLSNVNRQ